MVVRRLALSVGVAAMTLAVATALPANASPTRSAATTMVAVGPLDAAGHLIRPYRIAHRYGEANCESGSPAIGRAYECFTPQAPNGLFESCWVQANPAFVVCLVTPWKHTAVQLHVTRGYDDTAGFSRVRRPWGVRIGASTKCLFVLGSVHSAASRPITYRCSHDTVLTGSVDRQRKTWRVRGFKRISHKGQPSTFRSLGQLPIAVAWFGKPSLEDS